MMGEDWDREIDRLIIPDIHHPCPRLYETHILSTKKPEAPDLVLP
jgi:hypothetical protein